MKKMLNPLITVILAIVQVSLLSDIKVFLVTTDMMLVCTVVCASTADRGMAYFNAAVAGVICDLYTGYSIGLYTALFIAATFFVTVMIKFMYKGSVVTTCVLSLIFTLIIQIFIYYVFYASKGSVNNSYVILKIMLPSSMLNFLTAFIIFPFYNAVNRKNNRNYY